MKAVERDDPMSYFSTFDCPTSNGVKVLENILRRLESGWRCAVQRHADCRFRGLLHAATLRGNSAPY